MHTWSSRGVQYVHHGVVVDMRDVHQHSKTVHFLDNFLYSISILYQWKSEMHIVYTMSHAILYSLFQIQLAPEWSCHTNYEPCNY